MIVLGDDDLISLAIAAFAALPAAAARPRRLAVVDCDPDLLGYLGARAAAAGVPVELIDHDLRQPLPAGLAGAFDVACTDPPYTVAGAELFLSRAVSALAAGPGSHVFFSFGARRPDETLCVPRLIVELGLTVRSLVPGFNSSRCGHRGLREPLYHLGTGAGPAGRCHRRLHRSAVLGRHAGGRRAALPLCRVRGGASGRPRRPLEQYRPAEGGRLPGLRGHRAAADGAEQGGPPPAAGR